MVYAFIRATLSLGLRPVHRRLLPGADLATQHGARRDHGPEERLLADVRCQRSDWRFVANCGCSVRVDGMGKADFEKKRAQNHTDTIIRITVMIIIMTSVT